MFGRTDLTNAQQIQFERLTNLEIFIRDNLSEVHRKNARVLRNALSEMYTEMYYMTAWAIEGEVEAILSWGLINPNVISRAVMAPIDKLTLNDRLERNRQKILSEIRTQLVQGIIKGDSYEKMARRMKDVLEQDANKARTVTRTEAHRIRNLGKMDSAKKAAELGIEMVKVWDATLDKRTRPAHRKLDGKKVGVDLDFVSRNGGRGPAPGNLGKAKDDINCRCTMRLEIKGYEPSVRRIRGEGVVNHRTYEQWAKARGYKI